MLQKVRDNLKGTFVAGVVFLLFIVPLVLSGVGDGSYLGSVAGTDAASVNGKNISKQELDRAVFMRKQQLLQREGVDPSAEFLKDENLRGPVLEGLTRRAALLVAAEKGGMGAPVEILNKQITQSPEFQVDGKFDAKTYQRLLGNLGYTSASYKAVLAEDVVLSHHAAGMELSSFATERELNDLVSLIQQKRSFFTVSVPKSAVAENVSVSDEETASYYASNQANFVDPEKLSVKYLELSVANIAKDIEISEEKIRQQYQAEVEQFSRPDAYEVAHILIENKDDQAAIVAELTAKLDEGVEFSDLVAEYSDDVGSKQSGGNLGVLTPGVFPEAFEAAVYGMNEGDVSAPVETDAGIHFIKVVSKTVEEPPTFEQRKEAIAQELKTAEAETIYAANLDRLSELTFSAPDLQEAAQALGIEIKTTASFTRDIGTGLAENADFRTEAFSEEVVSKDYNSKVLELSNTQAVVMRKAAYAAERVKDLAEVKDSIVATLTKQKVEEALTELASSAIEQIESGMAPEALAKQEGYEYNAYEAVERSSSDVGFQIVGKAFSMAPEDDSAAFDTVIDREGNHVVVGLTEVFPGSKTEMPEQQFKGLTAQLKQQNARFESASYESHVVAKADIDLD